MSFSGLSFHSFPRPESAAASLEFHLVECAFSSKEPLSRTRHIPYRNSKLTQLLQELHGWGRVCHIWPRGFLTDDLGNKLGLQLQKHVLHSTKFDEDSFGGSALCLMVPCPAWLDLLQDNAADNR